MDLIIPPFLTLKTQTSPSASKLDHISKFYSAPGASVFYRMESVNCGMQSVNCRICKMRNAEFVLISICLQVSLSRQQEQLEYAVGCHNHKFQSQVIWVANRCLSYSSDRNTTGACVPMISVFFFTTI